MARIRSIKPQFWEDEKVSRLSIKGRLLFIGTWNFADDVGIIPWQPVFIRSRIFTYDDFSLDEIRQTQQELEKEKFVSTYNSNGNLYAVILNFRKHQKINRPQKSFYPIPPESLLNYLLTYTNMSVHDLFTEDSMNNHGTFTAGIRNGIRNKEWNKEEDSEDSVNPPPVKEKPVKKVYGEHQNVKLTEDELAKLREKFGDAGTESRIQKLSLGKAAKGYKYASDYAAILNWERRDGEDGRARAGPPKPAAVKKEDEGPIEGLRIVR